MVGSVMAFNCSVDWQRDAQDILDVYVVVRKLDKL